MQTAILFVVAGSILGGSPENSVLKQLIEQGVPVGNGDHVKLPAPTMSDGLDGTAQQEILARIAAPNRRAADLTYKSPVAKFVLKLGDLPTSDERRPFRTIDLWFIAYGRLELFGQQDFLQRLVETAESSKQGRLPFVKGILNREEMKQLDLLAEDEPDRLQRFFFSTFGLFDRVLVSATRRVVITRQPESVIVAAIIDPRFTKSPTHPNHWRAVDRGERGEPKLGPPQEYESAGLYAKVTRMKDPAGALFIEYHHAFCEPEAWFKGTALLRSKLPMVVQDAVRKLRRRLAEAEKPGEQ
jgi:hypothetical protein